MSSRNEHTQRAVSQAQKVGGPFAAMIHDLVGCQWGRRVWLSDDDQDRPCPLGADQIVVLHQDGGADVEVKLCESHFEVINEHTEPHAGGNT